MSESAYLILQTGEVFQGKRFGAEKESLGELVFTTSMIGCLEALTDTNYYGQIVVHTFPIIGNCGVISEDFQSDSVHARACIVKEWCDAPSNFRSAGDIDAFFKKKGIVGLCGVDTRRLTRILRENGSINALVSDRPDLTEQKRGELNEYSVKGAAAAVSAKARKRLECEAGRFNAALIDLGANRSLLAALKNAKCSLEVFPYDAPAREIMESKPDGIVVSNGPGNPLDNPEIVARLREITHVPVLGVGLGHQLLALSQGGLTEKLPLGHRGANQPVRDEATGRVYITAQNHGYAVSRLPKHAKARFVNANDGSCEGVEYDNISAISSQFIPEASDGPDDTSFLLDTFCSMMEEYKANA